MGFIFSRKTALTKLKFVAMLTARSRMSCMRTILRQIPDRLFRMLITGCLVIKLSSWSVRFDAYHARSS